MPELPEVETVCRGLAEQVRGASISDVQVIRPEPLRGVSPAGLGRTLVGALIEGVSRRGKLVVVRLSGGWVLLVHLKMTGQLVVCGGSVPLPNHTHLAIRLGDGRVIRFTDPRRFGYVQLTDSAGAEGVLEKGSIGPEPLSEAFGADEFWQALRRRPRARIKNLLLEQSFVAGIGNIYADEILHEAGIRPTRRGRSIRRRESDRIHAAMRDVLRSAIRARGSSISDYRDSRGRRGGYAGRLKVYGRAGESCYRCGKPVVRSKIGGRSAHYCPGCQK